MNHQAKLISPDSPLEEDGFELVWGFLCQVVPFGLLPVLCSEVCPGKASMFSRRQSCRGNSQSPVVRIAEEMETEPSKPIDEISRGEITSHRAVSKENALWPPRVPRVEHRYRSPVRMSRFCRWPLCSAIRGRSVRLGPPHRQSAGWLRAAMWQASRTVRSGVQCSS